jgi:hypothetical protein
VYCKAKAQTDDVRELPPVIGGYDTTDNSGDNSQQEDEKAETDPPLLASSPSGCDGFVCVFDSEG